MSNFSVSVLERGEVRGESGGSSLGACVLGRCGTAAGIPLDDRNTELKGNEGELVLGEIWSGEGRGGG